MPTDGAKERPYPDRERFEELRTLLLGPERDALDSMRQRLDNPKRRAEDVASVLADAVKLRSDVKLRRALQPLLEESLQLSVQANPRMLADALFPIFGQAIKKSIAAELEHMLESLSQTLEQKVSLRSLQWRWEALRTHKSYTEVVLLRSLLYRVEQVFLIHRKTGLLLGHAVAPDTPTKDPEMVSGMLTAIQDFVRDSMSGAEGDNLDMIRMGEVGVVLAYTADAILCGFVRGVPPRNLSRAFQERLDRIVQDKAHIFRKFSGDTSDFDSCRPQLEACLFGQGETTEKAGTSRFAKVLLFGLPALLIAGLLGWWIYTMVIDRRFSELAHQVASQRGVVVTRAEKRNGRFTIAGLRDPLAPDPAQLLAASGMPVGKVEFEWQEYHSLQTPFSTQRAFTELKDDLERRAFRFATGRADVPAEQRFLIEDVAAQIQSLLRAGTSLGKTLVIEVRGNHDPIGTEQSNSTLAMARAETVSTALISLGIPASQVKPLPADKEREACSAVKEEERLLCRSAGFTVKEIIP